MDKSPKKTSASLLKDKVNNTLKCITQRMDNYDKHILSRDLIKWKDRVEKEDKDFELSSQKLYEQEMK